MNKLVFALPLLVVLMLGIAIADENTEQMAGYCDNDFDDDMDNLSDSEDPDCNPPTSGSGQCVVYPVCENGLAVRPAIWDNPIPTQNDVDAKYCAYLDKNASAYNCEATKPVEAPIIEENVPEAPSVQPEPEIASQPPVEPQNRGFWAWLKSLFT